MDDSSPVGRAPDEPVPPARPPVDPGVEGPLSREQGLALLDLGAERLEAGDLPMAGRAYRRVIGHNDADITAAGLLGLGETFRRSGHETEAIDAWMTVVRGPETPSTYHAWLNIGAARARAGDLHASIDAYHEAERRAPAADKADLAARLGYLTKQVGETGASRRWFSIARGDATPWMTYAIIGITSAVTIVAWLGLDSGIDLYEKLWLDKAGVAAGEYWRLWTMTLLHAEPPFGYLHLAFNMYALFIAGPIVERFYGRATYLIIYLLCAAAGSVASFVIGGDEPSVGASGAIFGLFGVLIAAWRVHDPTVDSRTRALLVQLMPLVLLNLALGFFSGLPIDNSAHIGGLLAGLWLGWLLVPGRVGTLASRMPAGVATRDTWRLSGALRVAGVLALVVVLMVGVAVGTRARGGTGPDGILATVTADP